MLQGPGIKIPEELRNLKDVLQLTDQDVADRLDTSLILTAYELGKMWKEKLRTSVFNYRATLAHELRRIQMPGLADEIIAGIKRVSFSVVRYVTETAPVGFLCQS